MWYLSISHAALGHISWHACCGPEARNNGHSRHFDQLLRINFSGLRIVGKVVVRASLFHSRCHLLMQLHAGHVRVRGSEQCILRSSPPTGPIPSPHLPSLFPLKLKGPDTADIPDTPDTPDTADTPCHARLPCHPSCTAGTWGLS